MIYSLNKNIKKTMVVLCTTITIVFLSCVKPKTDTKSFLSFQKIHHSLISEITKPLVYYGCNEKNSKIISQLFVYCSYVSILAILYKLFFKKKKTKNDSFISKLWGINNIEKIKNENNKIISSSLTSSGLIQLQQQQKYNTIKFEIKNNPGDFLKKIEAEYLNIIKNENNQKKDRLKKIYKQLYFASELYNQKNQLLEEEINKFNNLLNNFEIDELITNIDSLILCLKKNLQDSASFLSNNNESEQQINMPDKKNLLSFSSEKSREKDVQIENDNSSLFLQEDRFLIFNSNQISKLQQQQSENELYEQDQQIDQKKQQNENQPKKKKQNMFIFNSNTNYNLLNNQTEKFQSLANYTSTLVSQYFLAKLPGDLFRKNESSFINRFKKLQQQQQEPESLDTFYKLFIMEKFQQIIESSSKISFDVINNSLVEIKNINRSIIEDQQDSIIEHQQELINPENNILLDNLKIKKQTFQEILKNLEPLHNDNQQNLKPLQENFQNLQENDLKKQSDEQSYDSIKKDVENLVEKINTKIIEILNNKDKKRNEEFIKLLTQYNNFYCEYINKDQSLLQQQQQQEQTIKNCYILKLNKLNECLKDENIDLNAFCDNVESLLIETQSLPNCFNTAQTIAFLKNLKTKAEYIKYIDSLIKTRNNNNEEIKELNRHKENIISNIHLENNMIEFNEYAKELQKQDTIALLKQFSTQYQLQINIKENKTIEDILKIIIGDAIKHIEGENGNSICLILLKNLFSNNQLLTQKEYSVYLKTIEYSIEFFSVINKYKKNYQYQNYIDQIEKLENTFKTIKESYDIKDIEEAWSKILEQDKQFNAEILKNAQQEKENEIKNNNKENQFQQVLKSLNSVDFVENFSKSFNKGDQFQIFNDSQIDELQKSQLYSKESFDFQKSMTDFNNIWGKKSNIFMNNDNVEKLQKSQIQLNQEKDIFELSENDKQEIAQFIKLIIFDLPKTMIQQLINYTTMEQENIDKANLLKNLCGALALIPGPFNDFYNENFQNIENNDNNINKDLINNFKNLSMNIPDNKYYSYYFYDLNFINAIKTIKPNNDFCLSIKDTILQTTLDGNDEIQDAVMKKIDRTLNFIKKYLTHTKKVNKEEVKNKISSFKDAIYKQFQKIDENQDIQKNTIGWEKFKNIFTQCIAINDLIKDDYHTLTDIVSIQNEINNPNCLIKYINEAVMEDGAISLNQEQFKSCIAMKYFFENKLDASLCNDEEKIQQDTNIEISEEEMTILQNHAQNIKSYFDCIEKKYRINLSIQNLTIKNKLSLDFSIFWTFAKNMFNNYLNNNNNNQLQQENKSITLEKKEIENNITLLNTIIKTASIEKNNKEQLNNFQHEEYNLIEQIRDEEIVYNLLNEKDAKNKSLNTLEDLNTIKFKTRLKNIHILDVLQLKSDNLAQLAKKNNIDFDVLKTIHQKSSLEMNVLFNNESGHNSNFKFKALNQIIKNTQLAIQSRKNLIH
jgi:hypothetical protein